MNTWIKKVGSLRIALAFFVFLALFILIVEKPGSSSVAKKTENQPLFFPRLNIEQVTHVEIALPEQKLIELRRNDDGWMMGEERADFKKVEEFLNTVYLLKKEALVSKNPEKQSVYRVDPKSSIHVTLWSNSKERASFYVGRPENARAQYVRLEESNEVWESSPLLPPLSFELSQ